MPRRATRNRSLVSREFADEVCDHIESTRRLQTSVGSAPEEKIDHNVAWIFARNQTGQRLTGCDIVGIGPPTILPSDNERGFKRGTLNSLSHDVVLPTDCRKIGVAFKPVPNGRFTCVTVSGVASVRLRVSDQHLGEAWTCRADIITGNMTALQSSTSGGVTVLWVESQDADGNPTTAGEQWARVLVGNPTSCDAQSQSLVECEVPTEFRIGEDGCTVQVQRKTVYGPEEQTDPLPWLDTELQVVSKEQLECVEEVLCKVLGLLSNRSELNLTDEEQQSIEDCQAKLECVVEGVPCPNCADSGGEANNPTTVELSGFTALVDLFPNGPTTMQDLLDFINSAHDIELSQFQNGPCSGRVAVEFPKNDANGNPLDPASVEINLTKNAAWTLEVVVVSGGVLSSAQVFGSTSAAMNTQDCKASVTNTGWLDQGVSNFVDFSAGEATINP